MRRCGTAPDVPPQESVIVASGRALPLMPLRTWPRARAAQASVVARRVTSPADVRLARTPGAMHASGSSYAAC